MSAGAIIRSTLAALFVVASAGAAHASLEEANRIASDPVELAKRAAEADRLFLAHLAQNPGDVGAWYNLGLMRHHLGDDARAEEAWRKGLAADPTHEATRAQLAALDLNRGRTEAAVATLEAIIAENRFQPVARNALAAHALAQGDYEGALRHARNVLLGDPRNVNAALAAAIAYYRQGLYDQAGLIASSFLERDPKAASLHNVLALVYLQRDNTRKATEHFAAALEADPSHSDARLNLAALELAFGNFASAHRRFGEALEERPNDVQIIVSRAVAARGLERYDEARQGYERALELDPNFHDARYNLCVLHQQFTENWNAAKIACGSYLATIDSKHPRHREMERRVRSIEATIKVLGAQAAPTPGPDDGGGGR